VIVWSAGVLVGPEDDRDGGADPIVWIPDDHVMPAHLIVCTTRRHRLHHQTTSSAPPDDIVCTTRRSRLVRQTITSASQR
jgi:hypothetical protein